MLIPMTQQEIETDRDVTLVRAAKCGDMAAFEQLVTRHTAMVFRVAMHILASREDAEDVIQDAFLRAFQNLSGFEERSRFSTWLTRIAVNSALMKLRVSRRSTTASLDEESEVGSALIDTVADWRPNPEQLYRETELRQILLHALDSLPEGCRVVFLLRDVEEFSVADTAEMLNISIPSVKSRLFRARLKLRARLSKYFERESHQRCSAVNAGQLDANHALDRLSRAL
jgi:RNA polymerase sigma-70 factor, ECF subfamily